MLPAALLSCERPNARYSFADAVSVLVLILVAVVYASPIFHNILNYSCGDGESYQTINAVIRTTLLEYRQLPFWNPYSGGGNVLWAHPESNFLSPLFLPILVWGAVVGVKVQILMYYLIGSLGMYVLCRTLGMRIVSALFAAVLFSYNNYLANHLNIGYFVWMTIMWLPWVCWGYVRSVFERKYIVWGALFLCLILFEGGVHNLIMIVSFLAVYAVLESIRMRHVYPLVCAGIILFVFFLLSGIKLIPMLQFMDDFPRRTKDMVLPQVPYWTLLVSLLDRGYYGKYFLLPQPNFTGQEFLAYIGVVPFVLLIVASVRCVKRAWPFIVCMVLFVLIAYGRGSVIDLWQLLRHLPGYNNQFITVRNVIIVVFCAALIIGMYLDQLRSTRLGQTLIVFVLCVVFADLVHEGWRYIRFSPNPPAAVARDRSFVQQETEKLYPTFLRGHGNLLFWRPGRIDCAAKSIKDPLYRGEVYLLEGKGTAQLKKFTPNKLQINYNAEADDTLVVNQNFYKGWWAFGEKLLPVTSADGLISVKVPRGAGSLTLLYFPLAFVIGLLCTFIGIVISGWILCYKPKRQHA